jgi:DNA-binding MarR family transcriptional regulator
MYYDLITDLISMVKMYEMETVNGGQDINAFAKWLNGRLEINFTADLTEPEWHGKTNGRSADSVINTSLVHLYRYAKLQAKAAIVDSSFSTPDEFIYLISLISFGSLTKSALIKLNVHEKPVGMQIVNRLISNGFVHQELLDTDKRNRMIHITEKGKEALNESMDRIRKASTNVTAPLSANEKSDLIRLLTKLEDFHESKIKGEL